MDPFFKIYIGIWSAACLIAATLLIRRPAAFVIAGRGYWHFLAEPWKLLSFACAAALVTLIAPYTTDPTWDHVDGFFMSALCYATAPWVVATFYRHARRDASWPELYVAICAWLFSASWSYDIYLVWRDGDYPLTWYPNLFASSLIYLCAGLFWNLESRPERGVIFSFMRPDWPARADTAAPLRLLLYGAVFAAPVLAAVAMMLA